LRRRKVGKELLVFGDVGVNGSQYSTIETPTLERYYDSSAANSLLAMIIHQDERWKIFKVCELIITEILRQSL
jgi:hypothetical protein